MRTIRTKVYQFSELSKTAQDKAVETMYDINVDYSGWWECTYEDFKELCKTIGIDIDLKKTYFSGFSHQGSGSSFTADIDIFKLIDGIKSEAWKQYAPNENLQFYPITKNMERFVNLSANSDTVYLSSNIIPYNRESSVKLVYTSNYLSGRPNIEQADEDLQEFLQDVADTLNNWLYKQLEQEHDYQTSREAIIDTITANKYEFKADGTRF